MFERGLTIFRVRGIPVRLHFSLLLFLPYIAFVSATQFTAIARWMGIPAGEIRTPPIVWGLLLAVGLFVSILLHELSHALVAIRNGGRIRSIVLMMLGGVTQMEGDVRPEREAWMAFAGPLTSFVIAAIVLGFYAIVPLPAGLAVATVTLGATNAVIGAFNLLPAFPMDGGRVLRGLLASHYGQDRATRIATTVGQVVAVVFGFFGFMTLNLLLVLIAAFVYIGASAERRRFATRDALRGIPVADFMSHGIDEALEDEHADAVARRLLLHNATAAKVVTNGNPTIPHRTVGIVTTAELTAHVAEGRGAAPLRDVMRSDLPRVHPDDDAPDTLDALAKSGTAHTVLVVDRTDEVVGLVTPADLERAIVLGNLGRSARR